MESMKSFFFPEEEWREREKERREGESRHNVIASLDLEIRN